VWQADTAVGKEFDEACKEFEKYMGKSETLTSSLVEMVDGSC